MAEKVLVAMSGGVDSSVAAALLKSQGFSVVGATIKMWSASDVETDALRVADCLSIPLHCYDYSEEFQREVIDLFTKEYISGRTPNPCIYCNQLIKFGLLFAQAAKLGIERIATGHYVRILGEGGQLKLIRGLDKARDQSYFLYTLTADKLKKLIFPLGEYTKFEIRQLADSFSLPVAAKADSQEICFLSGQDYKEFLRNQEKLLARPGMIVDTQGNILGTHEGVFNFTIGQRRGLGIAKGSPLYVVDIDANLNQVLVGSKEELLTKVFYVNNFNWVTGKPLSRSLTGMVAIRYKFSPQPAQVTLLEDGMVKVEFLKAQLAVAPGQAAVVYQGDEVLGGGSISSRVVGESGGVGKS